MEPRIREFESVSASVFELEFIYLALVPLRFEPGSGCYKRYSATNQIREWARVGRIESPVMAVPNARRGD